MSIDKDIWPDISVIIPVYNEVQYIEVLLDSIVKIDYPSENKEVLIIDGGSTDGTIELIKGYCCRFNWMKLIDNDMKFQVYALNLGIECATAGIIIRCDAHADYPEDYFKVLVRELQSTSDEKIGNVGVCYKTVPANDGLEANVVAFLLQSKYGVGLSHRNSDAAMEKYEVDTVLFGAWKKEVFDMVGSFDVGFIRGQDYEHNVRLKKYGLKVIQLTETSFNYYGRDSIKKMCKMMFQYAYAKPYILRKHLVKLSYRSLVPAIFLISILTAALTRNTAALGLIAAFYIVFCSLAAFDAYKLFHSLAVSTLVYPVLFCQHISHGYGTIKGFFDAFILRKSMELEHTR